MAKSSVISVRMKYDTLTLIQEYSEILNIRPSTLIALVVEENLEEWVKKSSEKAFKQIWKKSN